MSTNSNGIQVATKVSKSLHDALLKRKKEIAKLVGIEPTVSEVVRSILEKDLLKEGRK